MIEENEIMCGNYFIHNDNWCSREHKGIFQFDSQHFYELHECTFSLENVEPIPLTEDILIRCGFEKKFDIVYEERHYTFGECNAIVFNPRTNNWTFNGAELTNVPNHLHTLQNLVKLLCNQTIELK